MRRFARCRPVAVLISVILLFALFSASATAATKYSMCQRPGTAAEKTIRVTAAQVKAHLRQGDVHGTCRVVRIVTRMGPKLKFHPQEQFFPDSAVVALNKSYLEWGLVTNEKSHASFAFDRIGRVSASASSLTANQKRLLRDDQADDPAFRYFIKVPDHLKPGNLKRTTSYVRVLPAGEYTDLQWWFYYPYNGHGQSKNRVGDVATIWTPAKGDTSDKYLGRHYGDWEHVTLQFTAGKAQLVAVFMSQHQGGYWYTPDQLEFDGDHPVVYVGRFTHANYPTAGEQRYRREKHIDLGLGHLDVDLTDVTGSGKTLRTWTRGATQVVSSAVRGQNVRTPSWLRFSARWGQYLKNSYAYVWDLPFPFPNVTVWSDKEVNPGPTGPMMKTAWKEGDEDGQP